MTKTKKQPRKPNVRLVVNTKLRIALGDGWLALVTHTNGCVTELRIIQDFQAAPTDFPYTKLSQMTEIVINAIATAAAYDPVLR